MCGWFKPEDGSGFPLESFPQTGLVGKARRQNLDGNGAVQAGISGFADLTHTTRAWRTENFV